MNPDLTRRDFLKLIGAGSAALAAGGLGVPSFGAKSSRRPNVLLILADDLGFSELGYQGGKQIPTPNIDSIATNGVRFTNGYVSCPVCSPTRAGLMTGRYQQRFGHELNPGPVMKEGITFGLPTSETTIASRFKSAGYRTGLVGKWHLGNEKGYRPIDRGFEEFFGFYGGAHAYFEGRAGVPGDIFRGKDPIVENEYLTDAFSREAAAFIDKHAAEPFFLYLAFNAVHVPMQAPDKHLNRFTHIEDTRRRTYAAMQSAMDDAVGQVLGALRKHNIEGDTLIFFLSDNGGATPNNTSNNLPLNGTKGQVLEGGIHVPFLMQFKGHLSAGRTYERPVISLDIAPTALAAAGANVEGAGFDGVNLLPFVSGTDKADPHDALYWRYDKQYAIRKGDWKLAQTRTGQPQLYNLAVDIVESNDLAAKQPDKVKELKADYDRWNAQLIPPLWRTRNP